jgi:hypothetical protein
MTIHAGTIQDFMSCIIELAKAGVCFRADATSLIITLTGGF